MQFLHKVSPPTNSHSIQMYGQDCIPKSHDANSIPSRKHLKAESQQNHWFITMTFCIESTGKQLS